MGIHCAGPNRQHYVQKADQTIRTASKKEFSLARADCELQDTATFPPSTAITSILTVCINCNLMHKLFITHVFLTSRYFVKKLLTWFLNYDKFIFVERQQSNITWRYTQVWLKGSVLKTDRRVTPRGGSNPSTSSSF